MSNEIQRFEFKGASLRALTDEAGEPWFVAKDVCDVLELSNVGQALARLDDDEKSSITLNDGTPGNPNKAIVSESGLYALVLASRKPEAHEFKRWVTHEVLPQIRKTGGYIPTTDVDDDMTILAKAVMIGQRTMEEQKRRIAEQSEHIKVLEPKARFADAVAASDGTCLIGELAKMLRQNGLDIGQNRLFEILRQDGYLGKTGSNRNVPTQKAMDLGLFRIKETAEALGMSQKTVGNIIGQLRKEGLLPAFDKHSPRSKTRKTTTTEKKETMTNTAIQEQKPQPKPENPRAIIANALIGIYDSISALQRAAYHANDKVVYMFATKLLNGELMDIKANYSKDVAK